MNIGNFIRIDGRKSNELRDVKISFNSFGYAAGSVLFEVGNTKVLCCVSLQPGVPKFLKGKKTGWLTAEYSMLPMSSEQRVEREGTTMRKNGRSVEISRLIGRSLRTIIDFNLLGERTIYIDCDVLQADGGTRTACITGSCLALRAAVNYWLENKIISENIIKDELASVSVGVVSGVPLLDLSYDEDSNADADFNFVITGSNKIVEMQGATEGEFISWQQFEQVRQLACSGVQEILSITGKIFEKEFGAINQKESLSFTGNIERKSTVGMFSLGNRINIESD